ncbi:MAG: hypothetical protein ACI8RZ_005511 [Myxococcota bacterium]|jgi:hypothetical protein
MQSALLILLSGCSGKPASTSNASRTLGELDFVERGDILLPETAHQHGVRRGLEGKNTACLPYPRCRAMEGVLLSKIVQHGVRWGIEGENPACSTCLLIRSVWAVGAMLGWIMATS